MKLRTTPVHEGFGVEVHDLDLREVTATHGYPQLRELFEEHSLLLFRGQVLDDETQIEFARLFGPLESPLPSALGVGTERYLVTNRSEDGRLFTLDDFDLQLNLANHFWHTDGSYRPVPTLASVLSARVVPSSGGATEYVSTRVAWQALSADLQETLRNTVMSHSYARSRSLVSRELAQAPKVAAVPPSRWRAVWLNPCNAREALYIASHAYAIDGMAQTEAETLIEHLLEQATREDLVYTHRWRPGDAVLWDERAMMHRGRPWPVEEERTLIATLVSTTARDGLALVTPPDSE